MDINELDVVALTAALPDEGLDVGAVGAVVQVFDTPCPAYEVEFVDPDGSTPALVTLTRDQFRLWTAE